MQNSAIEWTHNTFNPIRLKAGGFYCAKVSRACKNCYAEIMARRFAAMKGFDFEPYSNRKVFPEMELVKPMIDGWKFRKKRRLNFVSSMTDIFGEFVPDWMILAILDAEAAAPIQIFQNLTKRHSRALEMVLKWLHVTGRSECPDNMWFGFTVESQEEADIRLDFLVEIPAKTLFVSCEPLMGFINLEKWLYTRYIMGGDRHMYRQINWVICGGESGNKKDIQPMHPMWPESLQKQCNAAGVPFFFKQWGEWAPGSNVVNRKYQKKHIVMLSNGDFAVWDFKSDAPYISHVELQKKYSPDEWNNLDANVMARVGKHPAGCLLDDKEYKEFPKY